MIYDVIIVGAGMAGLYCSYKILKKDPSVQLLILEKNETAGGRAGMKSFHGVNVNIGAGVGRKKKDVLLNKLLKDLDIETHDFQHSKKYASNIQPSCNISSIFRRLKENFIKHPKNTTFEQFANNYEDFISLFKIKFNKKPKEEYTILFDDVEPNELNSDSIARLMKVNRSFRINVIIIIKNINDFPIKYKSYVDYIFHSQESNQLVLKNIWEKYISYANFVVFCQIMKYLDDKPFNYLLLDLDTGFNYYTFNL